MQGILINPRGRTVAHITIDDRDEDGYSKAVGYDGEKPWLEWLSIGDGHGMYVDEEGLLKKGLRMFSFEGLILVGKALILGDKTDGDDIDATISISDVYDKIVWLDGTT